MSNTSKKLKINVFGELWTLKKVSLSTIEMEYYRSIASGMNQPLHEALIDPFFYPKLKLENRQSFFDLKGEEISGATTNSANQLDIWCEGNREKIWIANLKNTTLFPIYQVNFEEKVNTLSNGIYIETLEFGKIGSYEIVVDSFIRENLEFHFLTYGKAILLQNKFCYNGKNLTKKKSDCSITSLHSFEIG
jgi:hypothetical protein